MDYKEFILDKVRFGHGTGFKVDPASINPMLKPHQRDIVRWAVEGGRRAIFAAFGLGKSFMQLEALRIVGAREGGRQLIIAPLGVRGEFMTDADKLGTHITFVRRTDDLAGHGLYITNYESVRDGRLDVSAFNAVSLDEADVLRSYGSLTFQTFLTLFASVKYRFVATATPSPNRFKELIHYAGFLGIVDTGQSLTRFFQRYSNPGELVFDPFGGLMTVPYRAVKMGRMGYGVELNPDYWRDGVKYCRAAEQDVTAPSLFDMCKIGSGDTTAQAGEVR